MKKLNLEQMKKLNQLRDRIAMKYGGGGDPTFEISQWIEECTVVLERLVADLYAIDDMYDVFSMPSDEAKKRAMSRSFVEAMAKHHGVIE